MEEQSNSEELHEKAIDLSINAGDGDAEAWEKLKSLEGYEGYADYLIATRGDMGSVAAEILSISGRDCIQREALNKTVGELTEIISSGCPPSTSDLPHQDWDAADTAAGRPPAASSGSSPASSFSGSKDADPGPQFVGFPDPDKHRRETGKRARHWVIGRAQVGPWISQR